MSYITKRVNSSNGFEQNGNYAFNKPEKKNSIGIIREKLQINEWTFSLFLFCLSLSIVIGKIFVNYGDAFKWQIEGNYKLPSLPAFPSIVANLSSISSLRPNIKFSGDRLMAVGEKFINVSQRYEEAVSDAVLQFSSQNWTWIRAALGGIAMMGFTWYIIYKDSSVPGVNPPSPLSSLSRKRGQSRFNMQINYFVGILNGILIFIYLTL